jgi:hypothetical protein
MFSERWRNIFLTLRFAGISAQSPQFTVRRIRGGGEASKLRACAMILAARL